MKASPFKTKLLTSDLFLSVSFRLTPQPIVYLFFGRLAAEFARRAPAREFALVAREFL